jgi:hypothetical protein
MRTLNRYAVVTLVAATGTFACRTATHTPQPGDVAPPHAEAPVPVPAGTIWLIFVDDHNRFRGTGYLRGFKRMGS